MRLHPVSDLHAYVGFHYYKKVEKTGLALAMAHSVIFSITANTVG